MFSTYEISPAILKRRQKLQAALKDSNQAALIPAGGAVPKNYSHNTYGFRPNSHFIYLMGDIAHYLQYTWLFITHDSVLLFRRQTTTDDALWHGAAPTEAELLKACQVSVKDVKNLADTCAAHQTASLPATHLTDRSLQNTFLGRECSLENEYDRNLAEMMIALRMIHDEAAVEGLQEAAKGTVEAHLAGMRVTKPGMFEWQVKTAMQSKLSEYNMSTSYQPIVSSSGEVLHNNYYDQKLEDGDLLLVDVGAETRGCWAGDVTRTWPVSGVYSDTQKVIYNLVLRAQEKTIEMIKPGVSYQDLHLFCCKEMCQSLVDLNILIGDVDDLMEKDVHALFFPHGLGHLIGLDVHDMEDLGDIAGYDQGLVRSKRFGLGFLRLNRILKEGMAVTIEPGFYQVPAILEGRGQDDEYKSAINWDELKKYKDVKGIRIEDDILVTSDGYENLTAAIPKSIEAVEAEMRKS